MRALVVDPNEESRDVLRRAFAAGVEQVRSVDGLESAERQVEAFAPDVLVVALDAPQGDALAYVERAAVLAPDRAIFVVVDSDRLDLGVEAMQRGASDFLWRPISPPRVALLLRRLEQRRAAARNAEGLRVRLVRAEIASTLIGRSPRWTAAFAAIERAAGARDAVLLAGETGTEQEEAARALHGLSDSGAEPFFRAIDIEGLPALSPELRGTLFLPLLERRPRAFQEALLASLSQARSVRPIFAINEPPDEAASAGRIVPELFDAVRDRIVHLPPLREREGDVDLLARRFLAETDPSLSFDGEALDALRTHDWPGNVRELRDVVKRSAPLSDGSVIGSTVVLSLLAGPRARKRLRRQKPPVVKIAVGASLADVERRLIQKTLEFARGNKPKTAQLLKLSLKTIYNKIKEYGLEH